MEHTSVGRHVFISYRRAEPDAEFTYRLTDDLRAAGHEVWIDVKGIVPAAQWNREIQTAIDECYAYVVILSPDSMQSDWVRNELLYALQNKRGHVFPVLYRDVKLPPELVSLQYIDFRDDYDRALQSLLLVLPDSIYTGRHFIRPSREPRRVAPDSDVPAPDFGQPYPYGPRLRIPAWGWAAGGVTAIGLIALIGLIANGALSGQDNPPTQSFAATATTRAPDDSSPSPAPTDEAALPTIGPSDTPEPTALPTPLGAGTGRLLYLSNHDSDNPATYSELYSTLVGVGGDDLVWDSAASTRPGWSPDGSRIIFSSWRDGTAELYILDLQSGNIERLTDNRPVNEVDPAWSPDGARIAFASNYAGNYAIFVIDLATREWTRISDLEGQDWEPSWSPDGGQIVFTSMIDNDYELYIVDADGSAEERRLTREQSQERYPAWSPDGTLIAFATTLGGGDFEIAVMYPTGTGRTLLTDNAAVDTQPVWSPDGQWIAFSSDLSGLFQIYLMAADGSGQARVTNGAFADRFPAWQP